MPPFYHLFVFRNDAGVCKYQIFLTWEAGHQWCKQELFDVYRHIDSSPCPLYDPHPFLSSTEEHRRNLHGRELERLYQGVGADWNSFIVMTPVEELSLHRLQLSETM